MPTSVAQDGRRAALLTTVVVGAATALVLLVALWAASSGPDDPFRGDGQGSRATVSESPASEGQEPGDAHQDSKKRSSSWVSAVVAIVIGAVALTLLLAVVGVLVSVVAGLPRVGRRRRAGPDDEPVELDPVDAVTGSMLADAAAQEAVLVGGSPRNGIVECWHRFELQAGRAGLARRPWETSSEFTLRLLDLVEADTDAVARLSALYREARFSEHDLGEADREAALAALRQVHRDLRGLHDLRRQLGGRPR
jgi:multisubunit Na+/H+ antiporter MnhC subunit